MLAPAKHLFSVKEFYRMAETGILPTNVRVELLDGEIIDMSPIGPFHGGVANYLTQIFTAAARGRWLTAIQNPIHLGDHSEPQPDVLLLKPAKDYYRQQHPQPEDVYLLVEIADTSLESDQEQKLPAYGRAGVSEVWIVNLNELTIEVYREPHFNGYGGKIVLRAGDQATPSAFPEVAVDVAELLKR
jgi:Uma2 family endonuclease